MGKLRKLYFMLNAKWRFNTKPAYLSSAARPLDQSIPRNTLLEQVWHRGGFAWHWKRMTRLILRR
jgi:hypothetical protein